MTAPVAAGLFAGAAVMLGALGLRAVASPVAILEHVRPLSGRAGTAARQALEWLQHVTSPETSLDRGARMRLRLAAGAGALALGVLLVGLQAGVVLSLAAAWAAPRAVAARRARHGRRVDEGAGAAALALADSLSAGASTRGCVAVAADRLRGPVARELGHTAWELEVGAATEPALDRLCERSASRGLGLIVAAMQVQRRCGGDLARVLREVAAALEDERRLREEARAATAQARFTAVVVVALPAGGIALAAVASPGLLARMTSSGLGLALLSTALLLQALGALLIRRLAGPWD